jgi:hypothetical protein
VTQDMKFVPDRLVVGPHGQPVLESGYTEIAGVRFYPDRLVVGPHGQPVISKGRTEVVTSRCPPRQMWR